jgi:hypothetical protein
MRIQRLVICLFVLCAQTLRAELVNDRYRIDLQSDGSVRIIRTEAVSVVFESSFIVIYRDGNPRFALRPNRVPNANLSVETWYTGKTDSKWSGKSADLTRTVGDGWDPSILAGDQDGRTADLFASGLLNTVKAKASNEDAKGIHWIYPDNEAFSLCADITLPAGDAEPVIKVKFIPRKDGWFSIGYVGARSVDATEADEIFQPPLWTRRRIPAASYLTSAFRCTIPTALVTSGNCTWGVAADPSMLPFQPLPLLNNSQFGVALRDRDGNVRPMVFVPILGGIGSKMTALQPMVFVLRPYVGAGSLHKAYVDIARGMMGVRDYRTNSISSLNDTLANILDYAFTPYACFNEDLRGSAYDTDVPGSVNNVTGLHPLSIALLTDDERIYWKRALPMFEAGLSRSKMLFTVNPSIKGQGASTGLEGPNLRGSEFADWYGITGCRDAWLLDLAKASPATWIRDLSIYEATGDRAYIKSASARARADMARMASQSGEMKHIGFWANAWPWIAQWELFEATKDPEFMKTAVQGAREYTHFIWMGPTIPEGDVEVNPDNKAPLYWYMKDKGKVAMSAQTAMVPAWRLSEIGLVSESAPTSTGHRAVFLAMPMPTMLRMGYMTGDSFFHDLARDAIVGRSRSFPGYHINTARSDVYEKLDYPLHTLKELSYNSFHYNHIWPHMAMLVDYLVADVYGRSRSKISFPGMYVEGYGYLQTHFYGAKSGRFFDQKDAWLWLPLDSVHVNDVEINWLAARTPEGVGFSFANQSFEPRRFTVRFDGKLKDMDATRIEARVWSGTENAGTVEVINGEVILDVAAQGLVSILVPGIHPQLKFADRIGKGAAPAGGMTKFDFFGGNGAGYLISAGEGLTSAYIFVRAQAVDVQNVSLRYRLPDGTWKTDTDSAFPFEFTVRWSDDTPFEAFIKGTSGDGSNIPERRVIIDPAKIVHN